MRLIFSISSVTSSVRRASCGSGWRASRRSAAAAARRCTISTTGSHSARYDPIFPNFFLDSSVPQLPLCERAQREEFSHIPVFIGAPAVCHWRFSRLFFVLLSNEPKNSLRLDRVGAIKKPCKELKSVNTFQSFFFLTLKHDKSRNVSSSGQNPKSESFH